MAKQEQHSPDRHGGADRGKATDHEQDYFVSAPRQQQAPVHLSKSQVGGSVAPGRNPVALVPSRVRFTLRRLRLGVLPCCLPAIESRLIVALRQA